MFKILTPANAKCGEIFCHSYNEFFIDCAFCDIKSFTFDNFGLHIQSVHFEDNVFKSESFNTDCNQYLKVDIKNEAIPNEENLLWDKFEQSCDEANDINACENNSCTEENTKALSTTKNNQTNKINEDNNHCPDENFKPVVDFTSQYRSNDGNRINEFATTRDVQEVRDKLESTNMVLKLLLDEIKLLKNIGSPSNAIRTTKGLPTNLMEQIDIPSNSLRTKYFLPKAPFDEKEEFLNFEISIQASEEMFGNTIKELKENALGNSSKFIRNCWRSIMKDKVAQEFCWQGSSSKMSLKLLTTTLAIKRAYTEKFTDHADAEFEKITIMHFQQAKHRCDKKSKT